MKNKIDKKRLVVLSCDLRIPDVSSGEKKEDVVTYVKETIAYDMGMQLLKNGLIEFKREKNNRLHREDFKAKVCCLELKEGQEMNEDIKNNIRQVLYAQLLYHWFSVGKSWKHFNNRNLVLKYKKGVKTKEDIKKIVSEITDEIWEMLKKSELNY